MALVPMKKIFVVGPEAMREQAVQRVEKLGLLHVKHLAEQIAEPPTELATEIGRIRRICQHLQKITQNIKAEGSSSEQQPDTPVANLIEQYDKLSATRNHLEQEIAQLEKEQRILEPWGEFEIADLEILAKNNVHVGFYAASNTERDALDPSILAQAVWYKWIALKGSRNNGLAIVFTGDPPQIELEKVSLPERSLPKLRQLADVSRQELEANNRSFEELATSIAIIQNQLSQLETRYKRLQVFGGLLKDGPVFALSGFAPKHNVKLFEQEFADGCAALLVETPTPDDDVPIELQNNWFVRRFEPLIKMFDMPSYWKPDPTMFVAPFMGLFFGLCLGDGAYGLLLLIASLLLSIKFKDNRSALPFIQLLVMLGIFATVIGLLMGKVFGVDIAKPLGLQTPLLLYGLTNDPKNFFIFALALGGIQVFFGMLLKLIDMIRNAQWQNCLGVLGWMSLYPIGFLIYKGHSASLMLISLVAIFLFNDPDPSLGKRLGKGTWALYNVTSLFGDIMSYVRIFGLGLSSGIIAYVFNMIAGILWGIHPAFGPLVAIILLIFGHSFNFIMATIGAMVHSARLNFLEFYGKFFVGGGKAYSPFGAQRDRN